MRRKLSAETAPPSVRGSRHGCAGMLSRASSELARGTTVVAAALTGALVAIMFVGVIYRYVLNDALPWTEEVAGFAMGWLVFIGAAVMYRTDGHPASTLLTSRLHGVSRQWVEAIAQAAVGIYLLVLIGAGLQLLTHTQPHSPVLNISYKVAYAAIPLSGAVMLVHWLEHMLCGQRRAFRGLTLLAAAAGAACIALFAGSAAPLLEGTPLTLVWLVLPITYALGVPIAIVLGLSSMLLITVSGTVPLSIVPLQAYAGINTPAFLAIPTFMLTGSLMLETGMSQGLVRFACALVGRIRGGLALADVVASVLFADVSGSAVADTAAIGTTLMPEMVRRGYDRDFVAAHQAAAGSLGTLFPPSISMIIFATVTSVSVTALFLSSILPGLLVAASYMAIAYLIARRRGYPREPRTGLAGIVPAFVHAIPALVAPAVVIGGILGGVFTPYEAGAVAAVYVAIVGAMARARSARSYGGALVDGAKTSAMVLFIIANASVLAWVLTSQQVPQTVTTYVGSLTHQAVPTLALISVALIGLSIVLEPPAILIAVIPIMLPLVTSVGVPALQFGVVVMICGAIGMVLPPIGLTLLVSVAVIHSSLERAAAAALPYVVAACCDLVLVIGLPALTSWLPHLAHG